MASLFVAEFDESGVVVKDKEFSQIIRRFAWALARFGVCSELDHYYV